MPTDTYIGIQKIFTVQSCVYQSRYGVTEELLSIYLLHRDRLFS